MNKLTIPPGVNWFEPNVVTCAVDNTLIYGSTGNIVVIYPNNTDEAAKIKTISNAHERVVAVSTNSDWKEQSKLLVSIGDEKIVRLWDINTLELKNSHNVHKLDKKSSSKVVGVAFATDDRIISVSSHGLIVLWRPSLNETITFNKIVTLDKVNVTCMSICPHATWLAAFGISNGVVVVADLRKLGKVLYSLRCYDSSAIISLSWCPTSFNIFPENKRVILTPKTRLDKKLEACKIDEDKEQLLTDSIPKVDESKDIGQLSVEVKSYHESIAEINHSSKFEDNAQCDSNQLEEVSTIKHEDEASRKPSSTVFTKESRKQILEELANLTLNQQDIAVIKDDGEVSSSKSALESKNVKENPWVNLKHVDDDEFNNSQEDIDPRAASVSDKTMPDEFDFLNECTALKYRILGEQNIEESEDAENDSVFEESGILVDDNNRKIMSEDSFEAESIQSNITEEVSAIKESVENLVPIKNEFLLASSSKSGPICIWRAGTDGRMQLELKTATNKRRDNRRDYKKAPDRIWITVFWIKPHILLSSSAKGELLLWDLLKYKGNGRDHKASIVHMDHRKLLFTICGSRTISNTPTDCSSNIKDVTVWTSGQDKHIFETVLNIERTCVSSYLALSVVHSLAGSTIDSNRIAMGLSDGSIIMWNVSVQHTRRIHMDRFYHKNNAKVICLAWHPLREDLIAYATSDGMVATLSTSAHTSNTFLSSFFKSPVHKVEWGPLKGDCEKYVLYVCGEGKLVYYDVDNGKAAPVPIDLDDEYVTHMAWKPDYSVLAIGTKSNVIFLLSSTLEMMSSMYVAQKTITNMLWHPMATLNSTSDVSNCCNWLAIGTRAGQCAVYNMICQDDSTEISSLVQEIKAHSRLITSISWSPYDDGKLLTSSDDCTAQIWNVETGAIICSYISSNLDPITNALWSPLKEDLIICTAKDILEIWDVNEHLPKTAQEMEESLKSLLKLKHKYNYKPQAEKNPQALEGEKEMPVKTTKTILLPTLAREQNDVVQALSDCKQLLVQSIDENNSVMQFFGKKDDVFKMLTNQQHHHMKRNKPQLAQHLSLWKGDLSETIKSAIENGTVTPWLICMTPMVSPQLWQSACMSYAQKQSEDSPDSDPIVTASFFLACHDITAAVNVLTDNKLFREAISVIKSRMVEDSEVHNRMIADVMEKWAVNAIVTGLFEVAAQCYIYLEKYDEAAKALFKRSDVRSLQLAMDIANKGENNDLKIAIQTRLDMFETYGVSTSSSSAKNEESEQREVELDDGSNDVLIKDESEVKELCNELQQHLQLFENAKEELKDVRSVVDYLKLYISSIKQEEDLLKGDERVESEVQIQDVVSDPDINEKIQEEQEN